MFFLALFSFLAGIVTILSPCILPVLPIVLSGSVGAGKRRPLGIVAGFVISFTFFTLFVSSLIKVTGIQPDTLRIISIVIILILGATLLVPSLQSYMEILFSKAARLTPKTSSGSGFLGGFMVGLSLGLIWTPCVGPIIASVITLAASNTVSLATFLITLSYSVGTAIPMLAITYGGRTLLQKTPWLLDNTKKIQQGFGLLMMLTALALAFNIDRAFQSYILTTFPQYGAGLTQLEQNKKVSDALYDLKKTAFRSEKSSSNKAPELVPGGVWFNSDPLTIASLRDKVVLVDFWTYTCINCIRTLPYIQSWHDRYASKGLVIIGVHTPEFAFEKNPANVQKAIKDFHLTYPVMQDNDFATWSAYDNQYWPAKYLIDKDGAIRYTHFGEGDYDETEEKIRMLLEERGEDVGNVKMSNPEYQIYSRTPELYLGNARIEYLASPESISVGKDKTYTSPAALPSDSFAYVGTWQVQEERAMPKAGARLELMFEAESVYLVMRPASTAGRLRVLLDGKPVGPTSAGADVKDGVVTVDTDRLYTIIKLPSPGEHKLILEFLDGNTELYAFTFG